MIRERHHSIQEAYAILDWDGIDVSLDYTKWYGYIIAFKIFTTDLKNNEALEVLRKKFAE